MYGYIDDEFNRTITSHGVYLVVLLFLSGDFAILGLVAASPIRHIEYPSPVDLESYIGARDPESEYAGISLPSPDEGVKDASQSPNQGGANEVGNQESQRVGSEVPEPTEAEGRPLTSTVPIASTGTRTRILYSAAPEAVETPVEGSETDLIMDVRCYQRLVSCRNTLAFTLSNKHRRISIDRSNCDCQQYGGL
ncbi:hypothetical protein PM082_008277 [Marasmius tenuissimus]|nr:hypothetical protein PM082_008277 [Marasmius tenuissimus]